VAYKAKAKQDALDVIKATELAKAKKEEAEKKIKAAREADKKNISKVRKATKESLMDCGLSEADARVVVMAIHNNQIKNVTITY